MKSDNESAEAVIDAVIKNISGSLDTILSLRNRVKWKPDGSPVTDADVYVEELVRALCERMCPGCIMISEESYVPGSPVPLKGVVFVLDPIDGTENFCSGLKEWGVAFSMWVDSRHAGSLLFMPELGEVLKTGQPIARIQSRIQGLSSSMCGEIQQRLSGGGEYRIMGCAAYNLLNVIRGAFSSFTNPKGAYIWDLLPGLMLALEHNCEVMVNEHKYGGQFLDPNCRYRIDIQHRYDIHPR